MAVQNEEAVLTVKASTKAAQLSITELEDKIKALTTSLRKMHKEDDPALYEAKIRVLNETKALHEAESTAINGEREALKAFQQQFMANKHEIEASITNNPIKKFVAEARTSFEALNNTVQKSPLAQSLNKLKSSLSTSGNSSPFFTYIVNGYNAVSSAIDNHKSKLQLHKGAVLENKASEEALTLAMAENKAAQEAVNIELEANKVAQEASVVAVAEATTMEEAKTAAMANEKLVQEEAILTTKAQKLANQEGVIATEAQTIATEAQTLATNTGSGAMRIFKIAMASTGIGLLLVAIGALVAYFTETNEGSLKFKVIMAQLNVVFQNTMKYLAPIGKALVDVFTEPQGAVKLMTNLLGIAVLPLKTFAMVLWDIAHGNIKQAFKDIGDGAIEFATRVKDAAVAGVQMMKDTAKAAQQAGNEISKIDLATIKTVGDATRARQALTIEERAWTTEKVKQQGEVALLTKKLRDQNLSEQERMALAEKAKGLREKIYDKDLEIANKNEALVNKEQSFNSKKDLDAIQAAQTRVEEVKKAYALEDQNIENRESGLQKKQATKAQQAKSAYDKLLILAQEFNVKDLSAQAAKNDAEITVEELKYDKLIEKEKEFLTKKGVTTAQRATIKANIAQQETDKQAAVNAIREKQEQDINDKIKKFNEALTDAKANELQKQTDKINEYYDGLTKAAGDNYQEQITIEAGRETALNDAKLAEEKRLQDEILKIKEEGDATDEDRQKIKLEKINQHYDQELKDLKLKYSKELQTTQAFQDAKNLILANKTKAIGVAEAEDPAIKKEKEKTAKISEFELKTAKSTVGSLFSIRDKNRQTDTDSTIKNLEDQKNIELSNKNLTEAQKKAINDKYAKQEADVKLQAWKANQEAAIGQAIINGAIAMTKVSADTGLLSFAFDPLIAAETAFNVGVIAAEQPPKFSKGVALIPDGPSHAEGGISLINNKTGASLGEMEGGEPIMILSKETQRNNGMLINELLFNSQHRNGAAVSLNVPKAINAISSTRYAGGGFIEQSGQTSSTTQQTVSNNEEMLNEMRLTRQAIQDQKIFFINQEFKRFNEKNAMIDSRAIF